jgi:hypothetical protein
MRTCFNMYWITQGGQFKKHLKADLQLVLIKFVFIGRLKRKVCVYWFLNNVLKNYLHYFSFHIIFDLFWVCSISICFYAFILIWCFLILLCRFTKAFTKVIPYTMQDQVIHWKYLSWFYIDIFYLFKFNCSWFYFQHFESLSNNIGPLTH